MLLSSSGGRTRPPMSYHLCLLSSKFWRALGGSMAARARMMAARMPWSSTCAAEARTLCCCAARPAGRAHAPRTAKLLEAREYRAAHASPRRPSAYCASPTRSCGLARPDRPLRTPSSARAVPLASGASQACRSRSSSSRAMRLSASAHCPMDGTGKRSCSTAGTAASTRAHPRCASAMITAESTGSHGSASAQVAMS